MLDQPAPIRSGEELNVERLEQYLKANIADTAGDFVVEQFPSGYSNLTYLLRIGDREFVLRRPPFGNSVKSAHDMGREYRVLSKLCDVYPPAPRPFVHCLDNEIIGDEFYVMERRRGVVLRKDNTPAELAGDPAAMTKLCEAFIDNLALLHSLDYESAGLGDLGRPEGYVERQVTGWTKRYNNAKTDEHPEVEQLGAWLAENRPETTRTALIHNDYKYDNLMLAPDDLTKIIGVFDWEMTTVGDPLMDLGTALSYWVEAGDSATHKMTAFGPTMLEGSMTRQELVNRYVEQTGIEAPNMLFYYGFGLFKLAGIVQQIYARYVKGLTTDARFARMNESVASLGRTGMAAIEQGHV